MWTRIRWRICQETLGGHTPPFFTSWTWLREPRPGHPLERPFAWALIKLDGADSALLHAVDAGSESAMRTGMRVVPRFCDERNGGIRDIACFVPED